MLQSAASVFTPRQPGVSAIERGIGKHMPGRTSTAYGAALTKLKLFIIVILYRMAEILKGTLDLLILRTLSLGPNHGLGIARRIGQVTRGEMDVKPGSLFPALYRLEERGWLASMPGGAAGSHPRAKLYKLTQAGRKQIATETESWSRIAEAMARLIEATS